MIKVHPSVHIPARWIGVDLNTTGHAAVAADPDSGKILKLGKNTHYVRSNSTKNCTRLYREGKLWKLKKSKSRERRAFKAAINRISRQIVSFAESLGSGIKFEKLFPAVTRTPMMLRVLSSSRSGMDHSSRSSGWWKRWRSAGHPCHLRQPCLYLEKVQPVRVHRGRSRKHFECPHCGFVAHADVNAAFNIALASRRSAVLNFQQEEQEERVRLSKKEVRRRAREELFTPHPGVPGIAAQAPCGNLLAVLE